MSDDKDTQGHAPGEDAADKEAPGKGDMPRNPTIAPPEPPQPSKPGSDAGDPPSEADPSMQPS